VIDIVPTILAVAGGHRPERYDGRPVPSPPGKSLLPVFAKDGAVAHDFLWWSHEGSRAIRFGDWKLVSAAPSLRGRGKKEPAENPKPGEWELFDLAQDRAETSNLAAKMPEKVHELAELWKLKDEEFVTLASRGAGRERIRR